MVIMHPSDYNVSTDRPFAGLCEMKGAKLMDVSPNVELHMNTFPALFYPQITYQSPIACAGGVLLFCTF